VTKTKGPKLTIECDADDPYQVEYFNHAMRGQEYHSAISSLYERVFRNKIKHGDTNEATIAQKYLDLCYEHFKEYL